MLPFFLISAFRNLYKHKGFSLLNIAGLSLGLTACLLIGLFVRDERQFDLFLPGGDQVYRVYNEYTNNEGTSNRAAAPPMFATTLKQDFPEVEQTARVMMQARYKRLFEAGNHKMYEESGYYVDSTFFDLFPLQFTAGSSAKALDAPTSLVISQEMAERYFGAENPVGKTMLLEKQPMQVKGVFKKEPKFHLPFNFLLPLSSLSLPEERMHSWGWQQFYNYVKVKPGTDMAALEGKFQRLVNQKAAPFMEKEDANKPHFQPLKDIHLYSANFKFDMAVRGNSTYVKALTITAIFILLIACFNFVNLATANSLQRAKEVGVRKAIGASRKQLIIQFTGETILLSSISMAISATLTFLLLPSLNAFTEKHIPFELFTNPTVLLLLVLLTGGVGVLAGFYPALVLSGFQPVNALKGTVVGNGLPTKAIWMRHGLVVIQFALSALLIMSTLVVLRQVNYLHDKDLGFNKEQIMFFPMRGDQMFKNYQTFKNELLRSPGVSAVSIGYGFPGDAVAGDNIIVMKGGEQKSQQATQLMVDYDYIHTLGLQLVAGRDFSEKMKTDQDQAFIINETAVRELGLGTPERALGQTLSWPVWGAQNPDSLKKGQIIGVVKDFHYKSLYDKVETAVLQIFPNAYWKVAVKMKTADIEQALSQVQATWNKFSPDYPLEYKFLDENFGQMYQSEEKLQTLLWIFTASTIFVACLGLFGLAAYAAERRKKEIGIRKVLGASVQGLVVLLAKDFVKLVALSLLIASPVAWQLMHRWLEDFAYRIDLSIWTVVAAGVLVVLIALLTVITQAIKAARANPVKNLRAE